jgi:F-type H+-transporting ATPase subunit b
MLELIVELLAFAVVVAVLYRWVRPMVQQLVRDRQDEIQRHVDASEEATRKLDDARRRYESAEAEVRKEVARIRDDARADAVRISEELREQAEREVERIRQRGQDQLVAQRDHMVRALRAELGAQSMRLAERRVVEQLRDDRRRSATVDQFLDDLEGMDRGPTGTGAESADRAVPVSGGGAS